MATFATNYNIEDIYVSEKDKNSFEYLQKMGDYLISQLVFEKKRIKTARNLYEGRRDPEEFKYLENTFGIETPISVKMTPLIKTRIDVLVGILLDETFTYKVTINDKASLDLVKEQKIKLKLERIKARYTEELNNNIDKVEKGEDPNQKAVDDKFLTSVDKLINEKFVSTFEIAASALIKFFSQDSTVDLKQKIKQYFMDLLITGEAYYRTYIPSLGADPILEICKPENIFYSKNTSHQFLSSGNEPNVNGVVHRFYLKRSEILQRYGHLMTEDDKKNIFGSAPSQSGHNLVNSSRELDYIYANDNETFREVHNQYNNANFDSLPVYHVEWLANNEVALTDEEKENLQTVEDSKVATDTYRKRYGKEAGVSTPKDKGYRLDRYEIIRIGEGLVYLDCGKSKYAPRSNGQPFKTTLSYNGGAYNDRNGQPYSLALSLKDLQDAYDVVHFFRDNLIANSGVDGSRINLAAIPKVLGGDLMERLFKFIALRKQGVEIIDPTEPGAQMFQHYGDFRASVSGDAVGALQIVIESIERQADIVTGVNRYMYQAAEQRDAVSNVRVGVKQTSLITKDMFELVYTAQKYALEDLINQAKITYKKGKKGSYIVGERSVVFDVIPDDFCFTDFNIHIVNSSRENLKLEKLNALAPQLVGKNSIGDDVLLKMTLLDSPSEVFELINTSMEERKAENNQLMQLSQNLDQMGQQLKAYEKEITKLQEEKKALEKLHLDVKSRELDIKEKNNDEQNKIMKEKVEVQRKLNEAEAKKDQAIVQLEREQLYAENVSSNAKEVRNNF